uniref:Uncharacterized protein n=1 Tax=Romanomermis culicivorax TaxID=13658 RepID=A0A915L813_ROMCU
MTQEKRSIYWIKALYDITGKKGQTRRSRLTIEQLSVEVKTDTKLEASLDGRQVQADPKLGRKPSYDGRQVRSQSVLKSIINVLLLVPQG